MVKKGYEEVKLQVLPLVGEDIVTGSTTYGTNEIEEGSQNDPFAFTY